MPFLKQIKMFANLSCEINQIHLWENVFHKIRKFLEGKHLKEKIDQLLTGNISDYLKKWHPNDNLSKDQEKLISQGKTEAYALGLEASANWEGLGEDLNSVGTATLLFTSKTESRFLSVREAGKRLRNGRYIILPKVLQDKGLWTPDLILEPLLDFTRRDRTN